MHCVQDTPGAEIIQELDSTKLDMMVKKGMDERVEMYSVFADSFGNLTGGNGGVSHDLASLLRERSVTHVYVVGLAGDYCVKATAIDAARAGFESYVIEEGTKCVSEQDWENAKEEMQRHHVDVVTESSKPVTRVRALG